jgi:hypothetical protein
VSGYINNLKSRYFIGDNMVYKYKEWTLYCKDVQLKNCDKIQTIYFFSKRQPKSGNPCDLPQGYKVGFNERKGLPYLKKIYKC